MLVFDIYRDNSSIKLRRKNLIHPYSMRNIRLQENLTFMEFVRFPFQ